MGAEGKFMDILIVTIFAAVLIPLSIGFVAQANLTDNPNVQLLLQTGAGVLSGVAYLVTVAALMKKGGSRR